MEVEPTSRAQQRHHLGRPLGDAGKPAQGTQADVHEVVPLRPERLGGPEDVGLYEPGAASQAGALGSRPHVTRQVTRALASARASSWTAEGP